MTEVQYRICSDIVDMRIRGHANYSEHGKDIVCAGISSLTFALIDSLNDVKKCVMHEDGVEIEAKSSYENILVANTVLNGLKRIAENYPDYVTIK